MSYEEVLDDVWSVLGCSCVDWGRFVSSNIFWCRWQSGKKHLFVFLIVWVCRSVLCCVKHDGVQLSKLWQVLFLRCFLEKFIGWTELDTLTDRLEKKKSIYWIVWVCKSLWWESVGIYHWFNYTFWYEYNLGASGCLS